MKKSKIIAFSILSLLGVGLCTGNVLAAYAITDNADSFEITITTTVAPKTVTFHTPHADDNTCSTYDTTPVEVEYGQTLSDISASVPNTASFLGFTFSGWYLEDTFENSFSNSTAIQNNIDLYAKFSRNQNIFYDGTAFYASSNSAQTVDSQYLYPLNSQTWGVVPETNNENRIDLITSSGVYKLTYSSSWTILRKIVLCANGVGWLASDGALMYAYGQDSDTGDWGDVYWAGTPSINGVSLSNGTATGEVYIDYTKQYIGVVRDDNNIELNNGSNRPFNSWKPTSLLSGYQYSKYNYYFYLTDSGGSDGHKKDAPSWGNGD